MTHSELDEAQTLAKVVPIPHVLGDQHIYFYKEDAKRLLRIQEILPKLIVEIDRLRSRIQTQSEEIDHLKQREYSRDVAMKEIDLLRAELTWYGDKENYRMTATSKPGLYLPSEIDQDSGERARKALGGGDV